MIVKKTYKFKGKVYTLHSTNRNREIVEKTGRELETSKDIVYKVIPQIESKPFSRLFYCLYVRNKEEPKKKK